MSNISLDEMVPLLTREATTRAGTLLAIFSLVSLIFIIISFFWDKRYTSYVQLYVDDSNVIAPILGTEPVATRDQANVAKQELFALDLLDKILDEVGMTSASTSPVAREKAREQLTENTIVLNRNNQLLEIAYYDESPRVAFEVATLYADLFLRKTMESSTEETSDAYQFIINQVESYRDKLEDSERRLERFRGQNPGISNTMDNNVNARVIELQRDLEQTSLLFAQASQRRDTLQRELNSESATLARDYRTGQLRDQIARLQAEIDVLSLSYTDDYPDIVRLRQQIEDIKLQAQRSTEIVDDGAADQSVFTVAGNSYSGSSNLSPVYMQLRSDLARTSAEADAQRSRMQQLEVLLENELERAAMATKIERELTELTRDYEINKKFYEDLLAQQQSARLTMSLGAEKQGVLYRIHQAANFPARPNGLRFVHIVIAGIVLATVLPFVYLFVFLKLDPRIRTASAVTEQLQLPLLATLPQLAAPDEKPSVFQRPVTIVTTVCVVCSLYVVVFLIKYQLENATGGTLL